MNHTPNEKKASEDVIVTAEEVEYLIRHLGPPNTLGLWFGPRFATVIPGLQGLRTREALAKMRAQRAQPSRDTTCPSCDGDQYDDAAGFCEECGFEGFDGDQH